MDPIVKHGPNEVTVGDLDRIAEQFVAHHMSIGEDERNEQELPSAKSGILASEEELNSLRFTRCVCPECKWFATHRSYVDAFKQAQEYTEYVQLYARLRKQEETRAERIAATAPVVSAFMDDIMSTLDAVLGKGKRLS